jgi:hypothetical protein
MTHRTPVNKNKMKIARNEVKDRIPFEYQKDSASGGKHKKSTPRRPRQISPRLHYLSPTMSSKHRQSNQKKATKAKEQKLYTIEDLQGGEGQHEVSKKLDMDKIEEEKGPILNYPQDKDTRDEEGIILTGTDSYIQTMGSYDIDQKKASSLKASFKDNNLIYDSQERSLKGHLNTPGFNTNDGIASKLSTIEKAENSKRFKDKEIEDIMYNMSASKNK